MIRILNSRTSTFCVCNPINVADVGFQLFQSRNELRTYGEVDFGAALRRRNWVIFVPRFPSLSKSCTGNRQEYGYLKQAGKLEAEATILEGDVVEFMQPLEDMEIAENLEQKRLGVVVSISANASSAFCEIDPLRQEEPGSNQWVEDEDQPQICVPLNQVQYIEAWPSQRMDNDRVSNPHGEHAHNVWLIDPESLPSN